MNQQLQFDEKKAAAFHEMGHAHYSGLKANRRVNSVKIFPENLGWSGSTDISNDQQISPYWTDIAVAGLIAEAKFDAVTQNSVENDLHITVDVVDDIFEYVKIVRSFAERLVGNQKQMIKELKKKAPAIQISISVPNLGTVGTGTISYGDVLRMTRGYRDWSSLESSLNQVCAFFNNKANWRNTTALADELYNHQKVSGATFKTILGL